MRLVYPLNNMKQLIVSNILPATTDKPYSVTLDLDDPFEVNPPPALYATAQEALESAGTAYVRIVPPGKSLRVWRGLSIDPKVPHVMYRREGVICPKCGSDQVSLWNTIHGKFIGGVCANAHHFDIEV